MVHILSGQWPFPSGAVRTNPDNPHHLIAVSEFDRRQSTIKLIQEDHPLMPLIKGCLSNDPSLRPTASEIHQQVNKSAESYPPSFVNKAVMLETIKVLRNEKETIMTEKEETKVKLDAVVKERDRALSETAALSSELEKVKGEMSGLKESLDSLQVSLRDKEKEIVEKTQELRTQEALLVDKIGSLQINLDSALSEKGVDFFTMEARLSLTKCSTTDFPITTPVFVTNKALCIKNDTYFVQIHSHVYSLVFACRFLHYNVETDTWRSLPLPPTKDFSLGHLYERLLVVGGSVSSDIYEFDEASQTWVMSTSIPPMPTARSLATVATWTTPDVSALIVCGGKDHKSSTLTTVEVYHSVTNQWHSAPKLPYPRHSMKHTIIENQMYLIGGEKVTSKCSFLHVNIPDLLEFCLKQQQQQSPSDQEVSQTMWQTLPDIPTTRCFPVCLNGHLLAIDQNKATIFTYCPAFKIWVKLGSLPLPNTFYLYVEALISLPVIRHLSTNEMLVIESRLASDVKIFFSPVYETTMHLTANRVEITL